MGGTDPFAGAGCPTLPRRRPEPVPPSRRTRLRGPHGFGAAPRRPLAAGGTRRGRRRSTAPMPARTASVTRPCRTTHRRPDKNALARDWRPGAGHRQRRRLPRAPELGVPIRTRRAEVAPSGAGANPAPQRRRPARHRLAWIGICRAETNATPDSDRRGHGTSAPRHPAAPTGSTPEHRWLRPARGPRREAVPAGKSAAPRHGGRRLRQTGRTGSGSRPPSGRTGSRTFRQRKSPASALSADAGPSVLLVPPMGFEPTLPA